MTKQIWKYKISNRCSLTVSLPKYSKILSLQMQNNEPHMWIMVDEEHLENLVEREFHIIPTGVSFDYKELLYIDTFQIDDLVFHLFEKVDISTKIVDGLL